MHLTEEYIIGLTDGEGSFTAFVRNLDESNERIRRTRIEPRFYIKLVEEDKQVLDALKEFFGCGNVYFQRDRRKNHRDCYRFEVAGRKDLIEKIIPFFKKHPLQFPSKRRDFRIFCELLKGISEGKHLQEKGLRELYKLKQGMH
ncbi:MAG: LAGLIDADG family homing endonuclease [Patescibacteria group bacterium]